MFDRQAIHHRVLFMHLLELQVYGILPIVLGMHNWCIPGCFSHVRLSAHTFSSSLTVFLKEIVCIYVKTGCFALFNINYFNFCTLCGRKHISLPVLTPYWCVEHSCTITCRNVCLSFLFVHMLVMGWFARVSRLDIFSWVYHY